MSQTYITAAVVVITNVLAWFGIEVGSESLTTTIVTLVNVVGSLYIMWRRYQTGDITPLGAKK